MIDRPLTKFENSKFYQKRLIKKYKPKLNVGINDFDKIIKLLSNEFDLSKISEDDVDSIFWQHAVLGDFSESESNSLEFKIFKIRRNEKSIELYKYAEGTSEIIDDNDNIIIVFEESTSFMTSNCNKILRKMLILHGVSEFDYNNETPLFIWYLRELDSYIKEFGDENL